MPRQSRPRWSKTCNARTSTHLKKSLGFKSLLDAGGEPATPSPPSPPVLEDRGLCQRIAFDWLISSSRGRGVSERSITIGSHALLIAKLPALTTAGSLSAAFRACGRGKATSQVLIPVRELAAWIESNILLQLASAPFDKQDEGSSRSPRRFVRRLFQKSVTGLTSYCYSRRA